MNDTIDPVKPGTLKGLLKRHGYRLSKGLGQHFLINDGVRDAVADAAVESKDETVLEIGPGAGCLTVALAERAKTVIAVEVGRHLLPLHAEVFEAHQNVFIVYDDFRNVTLEQLESIAPGPYAVGANLPYNLTTPILFRFLDGEIPWTRIAVMIQKEVAERMAAGPGTKTYGALSVMAQSAAEVEILRTVKSGSFMPPPKVESAIVRLTPKKNPVSEETRRNLRKVVNAVFSTRRKTLLNSLSSLEGKQTAGERLEQLGIEATRRGETLSLEEFLSLAQLFKKG